MWVPRHTGILILPGSGAILKHGGRHDRTSRSQPVLTENCIMAIHNASGDALGCDEDASQSGYEDRTDYSDFV